MKEVLNTMLDYFILIGELDEIRDKKQAVIKEQKYQEAVAIRDEELRLLKLLPTLMDFRGMKEQLNK